MTREQMRSATGGGRGAVRLGKYTFLTRLGAGGMGEVYLAQMEGVAGFEKHVVVKRVLPELAGEEQIVRMFLEEARITARLNHPNVCQVFELSEIEGDYYLAMEYLEGMPVSRLLDRYAKRGLPLQLAVGIVSQACEGLGFAHGFRDPERRIDGVVHRDVSPQNLFVTTAGLVKVLDFGVAKLVRSDNETVTRSAKGKYTYMSPEQIKSAALDGRSDIFSLGVVLFECITGHRLFKRASEYETLHAIVSGQRPRITDYRADVPPALAAALDRALETDRERRFPTARAFAEAMTAAVAPIGGPASITEIAGFLDRGHAHEIATHRARVEKVAARARASMRAVDELGGAGNDRLAAPPAHRTALTQLPAVLETGRGEGSQPSASGSRSGSQSSSGASLAPDIELPRFGDDDDDDDAPTELAAFGMPADPSELAQLMAGQPAKVKRAFPLPPPQDPTAAEPGRLSARAAALGLFEVLAEPDAGAAAEPPADDGVEAWNEGAAEPSEPRTPDGWGGMTPGVSEVRTPRPAALDAVELPPELPNDLSHDLSHNLSAELPHDLSIRPRRGRALWIALALVLAAGGAWVWTTERNRDAATASPAPASAAGNESAAAASGGAPGDEASDEAAAGERGDEAGAPDEAGETGETDRAGAGDEAAAAGEPAGDADESDEAAAGESDVPGDATEPRGAEAKPGGAATTARSSRPKRRAGARRSTPSRRRAATRADEEPGFLTIDASPYANIHVGGRKLGVTPLVRVPLPAGKHTVTAVTADGQTRRIRVDISAGKTTRQRVVFSASRGAP